MKILGYFISLITICILPKSYTQDSQKVPGSSSCTYYASIEEDCGEPNVPVTDLPKEATSIFYDGLRADVSTNVSFSYPNSKNDEHLKNVLKSGKPAFLYYTGLNVNTAKDDEKSTQTEMSNLKKFLEPYKDIKGIILSRITYLAENTTTASLTEHFKAYLDNMKSTFPDYGIGLTINGVKLITMFSESKSPIWYDFHSLNSCVNFYVINLLGMNECTDELKVGGITPINGNAPHTIDQVQGYINQVGIPKDKIYYMYPVLPIALGQMKGQCKLTNAKVCASPNFDGLCVENTQSLFDKGKFAKDNGVGFIVTDVDLNDDPYSSCQCDTPYPAFHRILAGFNGAPIPPVCTLFDKK